MSINTLCAAFRKIAIGRLGIIAARCHSTQQSNCNINMVVHLVSNSHNVQQGTESISINFVPGTLNIDFGISKNGGLMRKIIETPVTKISPLQEPTRYLPIQYDSPIPERSVDLPTSGQIIEKQAIRLIVIRRRKMRKHKRKKLRKKMKYIWAKIRLKRSQKRERLFQAELISKVKEAEAFDAKEYVQSRLAIVNKERIPRVYRGEIIPTEMIKKFLDEKKARREAKLNKPRLTL